MQNCNIPPDVMMVGSPLTPDKTLPYIYSDMIYGPLNGWTNQRGARAVELLDADDSVTVEDATSFILDVHPAGVERWQTALGQADEKFGYPYHWNPIYTAGLKDVLSWNGELSRNSTGALKYYYFRKQLVENLGQETAAQLAHEVDYLLAYVGKPAPPLELSDDNLKAIVFSFASAMTKLKTDHGSFDVEYGDVFRVGRDNVSWPVGGGGDESLGLMTLRNVDYGPERADHTRWGEAGQTSTQIVVLGKPVRSWTALPIGESDRPGSPHYRDQAEKLFSPRRLKPTWYASEELAEHVESRTVLEHAPGN
jgi:acyl-homoserine lactone acylase PvdQ